MSDVAKRLGDEAVPLRAQTRERMTLRYRAGERRADPS
jgi:hypothetical protein